MVGGRWVGCKRFAVCGLRSVALWSGALGSVMTTTERTSRRQRGKCKRMKSESDGGDINHMQVELLKYGKKLYHKSILGKKKVLSNMIIIVI